MSSTVAMTFSGGLGLAAYHAGAYQAFSDAKHPLHWVTGSSAGAITAALIAGNRPADRLKRLSEFWNCPPVDQEASPQPSRHYYGWLAAVRTRLAGNPGHFHPRLPFENIRRFRSLYDLAPMKRRLLQLIDFDRLNRGDIRVSVVATDLETGEPVTFDSAKVPVQVDHLLASCGFLPEFEPIELDGRLLGDGGLSLNAPFDPILEEKIDDPLLLYVMDLYARDGDRPMTLEAAAERKNDLLFGNQTTLRLNYLLQVRELKARASRQADAHDRILLLSYRPGLEEPGPEKSFELSPSAFAQRWSAGFKDMVLAERLAGDGLITVRRPADS